MVSVCCLRYGCTNATQRVQAISHGNNIARAIRLLLLLHSALHSSSGAIRFHSLDNTYFDRNTLAHIHADTHRKRKETQREGDKRRCDEATTCTPPNGTLLVHSFASFFFILYFKNLQQQSLPWICKFILLTFFIKLKFLAPGLRTTLLTIFKVLIY